MIALCALASLLFAQGVVRLRRRGRPDLASWRRVGLFALGIVLVVLALVPFDELADENLAAHMTQHVLIGDLAIALLVLATRGPLSLFLLPPAVLAPLARSRVRTVVSTLLRPRVAYVAWAGNLAFWHVPWLYDTAVAHEWVHYLEHTCWSLAGLLVWTILLDDRRSRGRRVALAAAMFASGTILTDVLVFTFHPIYPTYPSLTQQQLAGIVMMAEQVLTLGTLAFVLLRPRFRSRVRAVTARA
ncbi:MAG TPA: cytochrome c oxidase assembly protein [Gaiellaceae bacterium]|nr:cytochrome c oxidase assembly protein [Gaiellaceae bacterium]